VSAKSNGSAHGPVRWRVTWGAQLRPGYDQEIVEAYDLDEALTIAAERRPELPRPRTAFLVGGDAPPTE
jgi:hypothetical protein